MKFGVFFVILIALGFFTGCTNIVFEDNFGLDTVGGKPIAPPPGPPVGDDLIMNVGDIGDIEKGISVINSVLASKAVQIRKSQTAGTIFECITAGGPYTDGRYRARYKAYSKSFVPSPGATIESLVTTIVSSSGNLAFKLSLSDAQYKLASGDDPDETLSVGYAIGSPQIILIDIDMNIKRFWLKIDGVDVAQKRKFLDPDFDDVHSLRFEYLARNMTQGYYVVDDIVISH